MMKPLARLLFLIPLIALAGGCVRSAEPLNFPMIVSGEVHILRGVDAGNERFLRSEEIAAVSEWLKTHNEGWRDLLEAPPPPKAVIVLHFATRHVTMLNVFDDCPLCQQWSTSVVISESDVSDGIVQKFTEHDLAPIQRLTGR